MCSVLAFLSVAIAWLVPPYVLAAGGVALGLRGRESERRRRATIAIVVGALAAVLGLVVADTGTGDED